MLFKNIEEHFQATRCLRNALDLCSLNHAYKQMTDGYEVLKEKRYTIRIGRATWETLELKITENDTEKPLFKAELYRYHPKIIKKLLVFEPGNWRENLEKDADFIRHRFERDLRRDYENHYC